MQESQQGSTHLINIRRKCSGYQHQGSFQILRQAPCFVPSLPPPSHPWSFLEKANRSLQCPQTENGDPEKLHAFSKVTQPVHGKTLSRTYVSSTTDTLHWVYHVRVSSEIEFEQCDKTQLPVKWNCDLQGDARSFKQHSSTRWTKVYRLHVRFTFTHNRSL